jgi:hypothetical protein
VSWPGKAAAEADPVRGPSKKQDAGGRACGRAKANLVAAQRRQALRKGLRKSFVSTGYRAKHVGHKRGFSFYCGSLVLQLLAPSGKLWLSKQIPATRPHPRGRLSNQPLLAEKRLALVVVQIGRDCLSRLVEGVHRTLVLRPDTLQCCNDILTLAAKLSLSLPKTITALDHLGIWL